MKVSIPWLKELVDLKISPEELAKLLPLKTIAVKEVTSEFIELDMKGYNRADLLSLRGVAREVSAITESKLKFSDQNEYIWNRKNLPKVKVEVQDDKLCPIYCVAKIEGLKVTSSTQEVTKKLKDSGIRSIDNITDITNLMMIEYGQTMHAFDASKVQDETMIIRQANKGEEFTTLDGKLRKLTSDDLLIADPKRSLSLSGIMGGKDSEISENTHTILLEVAIFDPFSTRKTSQRLKLFSEASKRQQHGLTKTNLLQALSAAIKSYEQIGGKLTAINLVGNLEDKSKIIELSQEKVDSLLGVELATEQIEQSLQKLGLHTRCVNQNWEVTVPYWRLDIKIEEDLVEEVARMYGYEKIPAKELEPSNPEKIDQSLPNFIYDLKVKLADLGLTEVQSYSFYSTAVLKALGNVMDNNNSLVKVANPISSETEYMRQDLWPNLVEVLGKNIRQGFKDIAIFEIGKVYLRGKEEIVEKYRLSIALMNDTDNPIDELASLIKNLKLNSEGTKLNPSYFHPKRIKDNMGEVHLKLLNKLGLEKRVAIVEFELEKTY